MPIGYRLFHALIEHPFSMYQKTGSPKNGRAGTSSRTFQFSIVR
ncbi:MAG: hypothetical protein ACYDAM_06560 [Leptospirales bacterium]